MEVTMYKYKTKGDAELTIMGVGVTVNGEITSDHPIENPNLELISGPNNQQPNATHMNGVAPQSAQPQPPVNQAASAPQTPAPESENR